MLYHRLRHWPNINTASTSRVRWDAVKLAPQTQEVDAMLGHSCATVCGAGPTLGQRWVNVLCLLECNTPVNKRR